MEENKKITKKQIVTMSIGVSILIVLAITATYAFFRFGNSNAFGTSKITGKTPSSDASSVVLENINDELTINLNTEDMLQTNGNTTYWASPEGKKTSETINQIGKAKAMVEGTYTCNYTMTIEDKATSERSLYNAFQLMSTKSNNQIVLKVNEETYDFNQNNLFPITYNGILEGITQSDYQYITASMYIKNELNIDQTQLSNKDIDIEFKVTEFNCKENRDLPSITRFAIGDNSDEGIVYGNEPTIYLEWDNENITRYCILDTNDVSTCTWINTDSNNGEEVEYTLTGNIGDTITLYSFIKDNEGFISQVANKEVTISDPRYPLTITKGPGVTQICTKINGASEYTCETPVGDSITKQITENSEYSYYAIASGNILDTCYDNNEHSCTGTMDNTEGKTHNIAPNMSKYVISISNDTGSNGVIIQTHATGTSGTVQTGHNTDTDYRYIGKLENVNNYVCLGTLQSNGQCIDEDHLYRIIGVMSTQTTKSGSYENRIKLIKSTVYIDNDISTDGLYCWTGQIIAGTPYNTRYTSYTGASSWYNNWEESTLNRVVLNQTYYNSLEEKYQNMIGNSVWYLGGSSSASNVSAMYTAERSETIYSSESKVNPKYAERKIGLMYPSDYGYATKGGSTTNRNTCLTTNLESWNGDSVTDCKNNDWLYMSSNEQWTITPNKINGGLAFYVHINGSATCDSYNVYAERYVVRPTFYLNNNVKIISGNGSISSPYTLG